MRPVKAFGLAVSAAIAAMAFIGASSAVAKDTALCSSNETLTCAAGNQLKSVHGAGVYVDLLLPGVGNITCKATSIALSISALGAPQSTNVLSLTWSGCYTGLTQCTVSTTAVGKLLLLKTAANLGEAQHQGLELLIKCGALVECTYSGPVKYHLLSAASLLDGNSNGGLVSSGGESDGTISSFLAEPCVNMTLDLAWEALVPVYVKS
jgi:hypothetical protein